MRHVALIIVAILAAGLLLAADAAERRDIKHRDARQALRELDRAKRRAQVILERAIVEAKDDRDAAEEAALREALAEIVPDDDTAADSLGRVEFEGHLYKLIQARVSWKQAQRVCEQLGGQLVCIETPGEQAFVAELADGFHTWIGATDEAAERGWTWVNGEPVTYAAWAEGQPDNGWAGDEHYAHLHRVYRGAWNDSVDRIGLIDGFICEWE